MHEAERRQPVAPELDSTEGLETANLPEGANSTKVPALPEMSESSQSAPAGSQAAPAATPAPAGPQEAPAGPPEPSMTEISAAVRELASSAARYHDRAAQREGVIDYLRSEVELLRRGERRGLLRSLLADMCRLRNDLLRQASGLPADYDAEKAAELLLSYAESIELTLESNGVVTYAPDSGDAFDPRMHRRVKGEATTDPALAGRIAGVQRDGYLDIEANSPIAPAEVTVFTTVKGEQ
jgi:molecular chaperone GrpE